MKCFLPLICLTSAFILTAACNGARWKAAADTPPAFALEALEDLKPAVQEQAAAAPLEENEPAAAETKAPKPAARAAQTAKPAYQQARQKKETKEQGGRDEEPTLTNDGRLIHPWYTAPELKDFAGQKPAWFGESLKFKIGWSFIGAGEANLIANKIVSTEAGPAFALEAYAQSYSIIDKLFRVRDINVSWAAADFTKSLGYWQSVREGGYARDEWIKFDYKNRAYTVNKKNNKGRLSKEPFTFTGESVWDMLSSLYFVRSQPLPLKGEIFFDIVNVNKQYPLKVIVHGKKTVKVKAGKFDCILVEPVISGEGIFVSKGKSLKVWLTDDEYKMPVKMSVEVFIGSVYAELVSFERKTSA
jgi:hypothetical protein